MIVLWKEKNLRLRVLGVKEGRYGEMRYSVCKETASNPEMGRFSVRIDETTPLALSEIEIATMCGGRVRP